MSPEPESKDIEGETQVHVSHSFSQYNRHVKENDQCTALDYIVIGMLEHCNREGLGYRKPIAETEAENSFIFLKYKEVYQHSLYLSKNMIINQLSETKSFDNEIGTWNMVGILSRNCVEWVITDIACQMNNITTVALYPNQRIEDINYIIQQNQVNTLFISPESLAILTKQNNISQIGTLKTVVIFNLSMFISEDNEDVNILRKHELSVLLYTDLIKCPTVEVNLSLAKPQSVYSICYTSGTTSQPKGAMMTQKGIACQRCLGEDAGMNIIKDDVFYSYFPLANLMERINVMNAICMGAKIGFMPRSDEKLCLLEDMSILKPTIFSTAPWSLISFHKSVMEDFSNLSGCMKTTAEDGLSEKKSKLMKCGTLHHCYFDTIIFNQIRDRLGGRLRLIVSGYASLPEDIAIELKIMLCCPIVEMYGMAELGVACSTNADDLQNRNSGGVLSVLRMKLVDKKQLNYHSKTFHEGYSAPSGEICFKGPSVFKGYFRDQTATQKAIDQDGWFHTGDIGLIDPENMGLIVVCREQSIFINSLGQYIEPSKIETIYMNSPFVSQICIYGNSEKFFSIAIIVVDKPSIIKFLVEYGMIQSPHCSEEDISTYLKNEKLIAKVKSSFKEIDKQFKYSFLLEKPQRYILTCKEFSVLNNLLSPTMTLLRRNIQASFQAEINKAYLDLQE